MDTTRLVHVVLVPRRAQEPAPSRFRGGSGLGWLWPSSGCVSTVLQGAGGLLKLISSCCRCDTLLEERKQLARPNTCFPSLMHPLLVPTSTAHHPPSELHQGIACFGNSILMDFPYSHPHPHASREGNEGVNSDVSAAGGLLVLLPGCSSSHTPQTSAPCPFAAPLPTSCCRDVAGGALALFLLGEHRQYLHQEGMGGLGRFS